MAHHQPRNHNTKDTTTKVGGDGTSKRNIIRKGGSPNVGRKARAASKDFDDGTMDDAVYALDMNDPNYVSAEDNYPPIYHMCNEDEFNTATASGGLYYSPTFEKDKFIHATEKPVDLIDVANYFYKSAGGNWTCLKLDPWKLNCDVVYEKPAPVGDTPAYDHEGTPEFPHIYGGIPASAVLERMPMERSSDGTFTTITGI
jgi:uncharacterized protein (DUF952 family)